MTYTTADIPDLAAKLLRDGYLVLENAADLAKVDAIGAELTPHLGSVPYCQGSFFGPETKRVGRVLARSPSSHSLVLDDLVYGIVSSILQPNCHSLQLSLTQAIEIWPGSFAQVPHRDQDIWLGASRAGAFFRVVLPQVKPGLVAAAIFNLIFVWNEFLFNYILGGQGTTMVPVLLATGALFLLVSLSYAEGTAAIPETGGAATL